MNTFFDIQVDGVDGLLLGFEKYRKEAKKAIKRGVDKTALAVANDAKARLKGEMGGDKRILTGRLRGSVHPEYKEGESHGEDSLNEKMDEMEAVAGTNVEYGGFIEFGTKFIKAMSFLGFAAVKQDILLKQRVTEELNKVTHE
jgi:phage gpG-like protein